MKKYVFIFIFLFINALVFADASQDANAFFSKGDYLSGMNILTKAINTPDPNQRAAALLVYANFYEKSVGNYSYATMLYSDILKTVLPASSPLKVSAQKQIYGLRILKSLYGSEDLILKRIRPVETMKSEDIAHQISQLQTIIDKKPEYYRLAEVYYYLGRCLITTGDYQQAYIVLKKSLDLKPAINFYMPVNVYKQQAHTQWVRANVQKYSKNCAIMLLIITASSFYVSKPWQRFTIRHIKIFAAIIVLWVFIFAAFYVFLGRTAKIDDNIMATISAPAPFFIGLEPENPHWQIPQNLFTYGFIGIIALFAFSMGTSRFKSRILAALTNSAFAAAVFATLLAFFYLKNCDQKSIYYSENEKSQFEYVYGKNYFVTTAMEPYVLTNPKKYPNHAIDNVSDIHLKEWIQTYCPFDNNVKKINNENR
jgi:tetratricopeptide (TPR) repeat protein